MSAAKPQPVSVAFTVDNVDTFPSAEDCARDLAHMLDPDRFRVHEVVVRDVHRIRWDDKWAAGVSR